MTIQAHEAYLKTEMYECVPEVEPLRCYSSEVSEIAASDAVHVSTLTQHCPYMPITFRELVRTASKLGPAQPLAGQITTKASDTSGAIDLSSDESSAVKAPRPSLLAAAAVLGTSGNEHSAGLGGTVSRRAPSLSGR